MLLRLIFSLALLAAWPFEVTAGEPAGDRLAVGPFTLVGDEPPAIAIGLGAFDVVGEQARGTEGARPEARVELYLGRKLLFLGPEVGLEADGDGGILGYGGLWLDLEIGRWALLPAGSLAGYRRGESKRLGGPLLFQAELTSVYRFENQVGCGLTFAHVSNGYRERRNAGAESLLVTLLVPF